MDSSAFFIEINFMNKKCLHFEKMFLYNIILVFFFYKKYFLLVCETI